MTKEMTNGISASLSEDIDNPEWDAFLQSVPAGQFQQSSMWARTKCSEGWKSIRVIYREQNHLIGGFQLFHRGSKLGHIGYISKGPVLPSNNYTLFVESILEIKQICRNLGLTAVILQTPDIYFPEDSLMQKLELIPERFMKVITASLWFELGDNGESVMKRIPKTTRNPIRQAIRRGVSVRDGNQDDLPLFFELMKSTCTRQKTHPNPSNLKSLETLFEAFQISGSLKMMIASVADSPIAALLFIDFGKRRTIWKKGWDFSHADLHPNHILYYKCLEDANELGFDFCDFASLNRNIAKRLISGIPLSPKMQRSRDRFHLSFGGQPVLLPNVWVWIPNQVFRCFYKLSSHFFLS